MSNLEDIRKEIDKLDDQIIPLLEKRFSIIKKIKKESKNLTDNKREESILSKSTYSSVKQVYKCIFEESKKIEKENIIKENSEKA